MDIKLGAKESAEIIVSSEHTAATFGSGGQEVLATPAMVAIMELAALKCLAQFLPEGLDSVGTKINISHLSATPVGMRACAEAEIHEVDRKRVVFKVRAYDEAGLIGEGIHERFVIDAKKFMSKAEGKKE